MRIYRDKDSQGRSDDVFVIEDPTMKEWVSSNHWRPIYSYINENTIKAHPLIIDFLLGNAEPLWSLDEILG